MELRAWRLILDLTPLEPPGSVWSTTSSPSSSECPRDPAASGSSSANRLTSPLRLAGVEWANACPGTSRGGVAEGEKGIVACVLSPSTKSNSEGPMFNQKRLGTFASLIASHITFATHPSMNFHALEKSVDLWNFPNIRQDLNGPIQPKVVGLDEHLLSRLVEPVSEERSGCSNQVLYWREPGISI